MNSKKKKIVRYFLLFLFLTFIFLGYFFDELNTILTNAIFICFSCVGIG